MTTAEPAWGVEIELSIGQNKSIFRSARRVILDGECAQIQLPDGSYEAYPIERVRKVLSMRAEPRPGYTDDSDPDELY